MRRVMNTIMLSCRQATEMIEKKMHCRLEGMQGVQLKMHLAMCKYCRRYNKQTHLIDRLLKRHRQFNSSTFDKSVLEKRIIADLECKL